MVTGKPLALVTQKNIHAAQGFKIHNGYLQEQTEVMISRDSLCRL